VRCFTLQDLNDISKRQCVTFEKTTKGREVTPEEAEKDGKLMELVREQTDQWTQLMNAQRRARWDLTKADKKSSLIFLHCTENQIYAFPEKELRGLSSNSYIHVSVSDLYIPRIGPHIWLQQNRQTDPGDI
jgi:hypothetical protein